MVRRPSAGSCAEDRRHSQGEIGRGIVQWVLGKKDSNTGTGRTLHALQVAPEAAVEKHGGGRGHKWDEDIIIELWYL